MNNVTINPDPNEAAGYRKDIKKCDWINFILFLLAQVEVHIMALKQQQEDICTDAEVRNHSNTDCLRLA